MLLTGLYLIWGLVWGCSQLPQPEPSSSSPIKQEQLGIASPLTRPTRYSLLVEPHKIEVELACTVQEQSQGLMFRQSLEKNHGMLFIFSSPRTLSFWMKNTLIPLDIAYIDSSGRIIDIQAMEPETITPHPSVSEAQYALEMNQGWFREQKVGLGTLIQIPKCPSSE